MLSAVGRHPGLVRFAVENSSFDLLTTSGQRPVRVLQRRNVWTKAPDIDGARFDLPPRAKMYVKSEVLYFTPPSAGSALAIKIP